MTHTDDSHQSDDTLPDGERTASDDATDDGGESTARLEFSDTVAIDAVPEALWATVSDPETLTRCVPGAESIERVTDRTFTLEITRGVSHLTVSLSGEAEFVELNPPDSVVTTATAFDEKTGSHVDVLAAMEIREADDGTSELVYRAEVDFSGGVASVSDRVLRPVIERDVSTYFDNVKREVEGDGG